MKKKDLLLFLTLTANKNIAAQITQIAQNLLQEKIIEFKNKSSKEMLDFAIETIFR
jgi:hypothetical protein